ncbi:MAG TPA: prolipoprotein diacylglyceryl transferase family protein, partial [Casimicrobiaceae bacterium]
MILTYPGFNPIALGFGPYTVAGLTLGPFAIRWYGLMYLVAFMLVIVLGKKRAKQNMLTGWRTLDVDDMLYYGVFGTIIGGRLGY